MLTNLFQPGIPEHRLHPAFCALRHSDVHVYARDLMNSLYGRMGDPNGNFPRDFQTDGFHSRLFELACFAYLESAGFDIDRSHESPDFLALARGNVTIAIEATTANSPSGRATDISLFQMPDLSEAQISDKVENEFPRRMASVLKKKLTHRYHELPHCQGKPLVLMVAPFFEPGASFYTDAALLKCLFGVGRSTARVMVPFFDRPDAASISGVLYCNAFTVSRFLRMAEHFGNAQVVSAVREGFCYFGDPNVDDSLHEFRFRVGDPSAPMETWHEGVTLFINPNASNPIQPSLLPHTCTFSVREKVVHRALHGFHPVTSSMSISVRSAKEKAI